MAKKQFVRGSWLLEKNVADSNAYCKTHKAAIDSIIAWANTLNIYVGFGLSEDKTFLCEYEVFGDTKAMCKGVASELKAKLKPEWKGVSLGYQTFGFTLR
ncbi:hypothetical protein D3Z52_02140 [Clostridiaceae bacterium]|nr:hypothetical protein [Clostridiaceae bacterium]